MKNQLEIMDEYIKQAEDFLKKTGSKLDITYLGHEVNDNWGKGLPVNHYSFTLTANGGSYTGDYWDSLVNSNREIPKLETEGEHKVYLSVRRGSHYIVVLDQMVSLEKLNFYNKGEIHWSEFIKEEDLKPQIEKQIAEELTAYKKGSDKYKDLLNSFTSSCINNLEHKIKTALSRHIDKIENVMVMSAQQREEWEEPTSYDILSCLGHYAEEDFEYFCAEFGYDDLKLSEYPRIKAIHEACLEEYNALTSMYSEEEMEMLNEIQ